LDELKNNWIS